jgi:hypothetical protein
MVDPNDAFAAGCGAVMIFRSGYRSFCIRPIRLSLRLNQQDIDVMTETLNWKLREFTVQRDYLDRKILQIGIIADKLGLKLSPGGKDD